MISVYQPNPSGKYSSVYLQQVRHSLKHNDPRCPRETILEDLSVRVINYKKKGSSMAVLGY